MSQLGESRESSWFRGNSKDTANNEQANRVRKLTKFFGDEPPLLRLFLKVRIRAHWNYSDLLILLSQKWTRNCDNARVQIRGKMLGQKPASPAKNERQFRLRIGPEFFYQVAPYPGAGFNGAQILRHMVSRYVWKSKPVVSKEGYEYDCCRRFGKSTTGVAESTRYWISPQDRLKLT